MVSKGDGDGSGLERIAGALWTSRALDQLEGDAALRAQSLISDFLSNYGPVATAAGKLAEAVAGKEEAIKRYMGQSRQLFNPDAGQYFSSLSDFEENPMLAFLHELARKLQSKSEPVYQGLFQLAELYNRRIAPVFEDQANIRTLGDLERTMQAIHRTVELAAGQISGGVLKFESTVVEAYQTIQKQHRTLRQKYQGLEPEEENVDLPGLLQQLLGDMKGRTKHAAPGPSLELVDDNCVLTEALLGMVENLPVHVEKSVPQGKDGKVKVVRHLDDWLVERSADTLVRISQQGYISHLRNPDNYIQVITKLIRAFYSHYKELEPLLRSILSASSDLGVISLRISGDGFEKPIADPEPVVRRLQRLSFLSIKPDPESVVPQNKVETDYAAARRKLFDHLNSTIEGLLETPEGPEKESLAVEAVRKAIDLKEAMQEIVQTERERRLKQNILGDNEFYVGRKSGIGEFRAEREPAPTIVYSDVFGESFKRAKQHIEEVVQIAAFPNLLKVSSPRGTLKSNILLIGPYGCGKTELARAVAADPRVIGLYVSVADVLTAWAHESVNNVKRIFEEAKTLRLGSRSTKPVAVVLDEFDSWFAIGDAGYRSGDLEQIQRILQEVMDGVVYYEGVFTLALTNKPGVIPKAILRRFKYADVVGQLNLEERTQLLEKFLTRGMPISTEVGKLDYTGWAHKLEDAPGDVLGKVADEVHFKFMRGYLDSPNYRLSAGRAEKHLTRLLKERNLTKADYKYVKRVLERFRPITREEIGQAVNYMLRQPAVQMQIAAARQVYKDTAEVMAGLAAVDPTGATMGFAATRKSGLWTGTR